MILVELTSWVREEFSPSSREREILLPVFLCLFERYLFLSLVDNFLCFFLPLLSLVLVMWLLTWLAECWSDLHAEDSNNTDVGRLAQLHWDQTIWLRVPKSARGWGNCGAIVLLDDAGDDVLKLFVELGQILDALLDDLLGPLVDLLTLVLYLIWTNNIVNSFFGDALNILRIELILVFKICHFFCLQSVLPLI